MMGLTGLTGLTGQAKVDFGIREMCKNPTLWTTLTGLTGFAVFSERSRSLSQKSDVPQCSKT